MANRSRNTRHLRQRRTKGSVRSSLRSLNTLHPHSHISSHYRHSTILRPSNSLWTRSSNSTASHSRSINNSRNQVKIRALAHN